jgi:hypothetical protein
MVENSLDVLEAAGVGFGFGEAICAVCVSQSFAGIEAGCRYRFSSVPKGENVHVGSSIRLMAPLMQADERWTMNE